MNKEIKIKQLYEILAEPISEEDKAKPKPSRIKKGLMAIAAAGLLAYSAFATYQWMQVQKGRSEDSANFALQMGKKNDEIQQMKDMTYQEKDELIKKYEGRLQKQDAEHEKEKQDMLAKPQEDKEKEFAALLNKFETSLNKLGFGQTNGKLDDEAAGIEALLKNKSDFEAIKANYETTITEKDKAIQALQAESSNAKNILSELEKKIGEIGRLLENKNTENTKLKEAYAQLENILFVGLTAYRRQPNGVHYVLFRLHFQDGDNVSNIMEDKKYYIPRTVAEKIDAAKILSSGEFNKPFERLWIKAEYKDKVAQHILISEDRNGKTIQSKTMQREKIIEFIKNMLSRYTK